MGRFRILRGAPEDWGLAENQLKMLDAELADHKACLEEDGWAEQAVEFEQVVNEPSGRRRLTGAHLAAQVAGTLGRLPTRREWLELCWLLRLPIQPLHCGWSAITSLCRSPSNLRGRAATSE